MPATVLVGCYERFLFGFEADVEAEVGWKRARALAPILKRWEGKRELFERRERKKAKGASEHSSDSTSSTCAGSPPPSSSPLPSPKIKKRKSSPPSSAAPSTSPSTAGPSSASPPLPLRGDGRRRRHHPPLRRRAPRRPGFLMSPGDGAVTSLALYSPATPRTAPRLRPRPPDTWSLVRRTEGISVWSAGKEWECLKTMAEAHSGPVSSSLCTLRAVSSFRRPGQRREGRHAEAVEPREGEIAVQDEAGERRRRGRVRAGEPPRKPTRCSAATRSPSARSPPPPLTTTTTTTMTLPPPPASSRPSAGPSRAWGGSRRRAGSTPTSSSPAATTARCTSGTRGRRAAAARGREKRLPGREGARRARQGRGGDGTLGGGESSSDGGLVRDRRHGPPLGPPCCAVLSLFLLFRRPEKRSSRLP